jgi:inhibitor of KinA
LFFHPYDERDIRVRTFVFKICKRPGVGLKIGGDHALLAAVGASQMNVKIVPLGDQALVVELAQRVEIPAARRVQMACAWLAAGKLPGVTEVVPAATTVTLYYSPVELVAAGAPEAEVFAWLEARVRKRLASLPAEKKWPAPRVVEIPVCYGGEFGPDLEAVAARVKLSAAEVITRHAGAEHFVLQLGFAPGFPYLHGLPEELAVPRRETPRVSVPAGSVAIANGQTGIYPLATPGGWNLIGRTPSKMFRPDQEPPVLLQPGDHVKFRAISPEEFSKLEKA